MKYYALILLISISALSMSCTKENEKINVVSTSVYKDVVKDPNLTLIDVRTPKEYEAGTLSGAKNIDFFDEENFYEEFDKFDRKEPIYIFCQSGNRSLQSAHKLVDMGFEKIYDMEGGYLQWTKDNK